MILAAFLAAAATTETGDRATMARLLAAEVRIARRPTLAVLLAPRSWNEAAHQQILLDAARGGLHRRAVALARQMTASERLSRNGFGADNLALVPTDTDGPIATAANPRAAYRLPAAGRILVRFGTIDRQGVRARGITLLPTPGARLLAPGAGRVAYAGPYRGYGDVLILEHGRGWTSLVAGGQLADFETGARLTPGQPIGTGRGPLLVELRHNGQPIDVLATATRLGGSAISQQALPR